jgi:hypothetical protein
MSSLGSGGQRGDDFVHVGADIQVLRHDREAARAVRLPGAQVESGAVGEFGAGGRPVGAGLAEEHGQHGEIPQW